MRIVANYANIRYPIHHCNHSRRPRAPARGIFPSCAHQSRGAAGSIVSAKFGQDQSLDILQECIVGYSEAQAKQVAENYDAFAAKDAERNGRPVTREARVDTDRIWFPDKAA